MNKTNNLTDGPIRKQLFQLTIPIIATNFMQTTYQLIDMIWLGRIGGDAVTAVGTATFYINLAMALLTLVSIGTGVKIAHSLGENDLKDANDYFKNGVLLSLVIGLIYSSIVIVLRQPLIGLFNLSSGSISRMAEAYLLISLCGIFFSYLNGMFVVSLTSKANSKLAFRVSSIGFILNIILDPLLIFGIGPLEGLGVYGAALATIIANSVVTITFFKKTNFISEILKHFTFDYKKVLIVLKMGLPITLQRVTFIFISIVIAVIVARFGDEGIAVQRIGVQIEAISFMTIGGLQGAIAAFIGQNYGAKKWGRLKDGYRQALILTTIFGLVVSAIFLLFPEQLFRIFITDELIIAKGKSYMRIVGLSQMFMCVELLTVGAFNGIGKTYIPPIFSIIITSLRIPLAIILSSPNLFGLNGIWISISITSVIKGVILLSWFLFTMKRTVRGANHAN